MAAVWAGLVVVVGCAIFLAYFLGYFSGKEAAWQVSPLHKVRKYENLKVRGFLETTEGFCIVVVREPESPTETEERWIVRVGNTQADNDYKIGEYVDVTHDIVGMLRLGTKYPRIHDRQPA